MGQSNGRNAVERLDCDLLSAGVGLEKVWGQMLGGALEFDTKQSAICVHIGVQPVHNNVGLRSDAFVEVNVRAIGFRVIVKLHISTLLDLLSTNAVTTVSPSANVTTRRMLGVIMVGVGYASPETYTTVGLGFSFKRVGDDFSNPGDLYV